MRRLFAIAASVALLLGLFVPAALAAGPDRPGSFAGGFILSADGVVDVPGGQHVDTVIVLRGSATIAGNVDTVIIANGSATFTGATVGTLVVADGTADLGAGTTVTGAVRTIRATVTQQPGSVIGGSFQALDADVTAFIAGIALLLIPLLLVLLVGFVLAAVAAGLFVATFAARQVREVEALITDRPGHALLAGIGGTIILPVLAILLVVSVVGAPIGFALAFLGLPVLGFVGWLVAAIWVGEWLLTRSQGRREPGRPYRAAVVGVVVLGLAGILPFVSAIATLFGVGGLLLAAWRILRPEAPSAPAGAWPQGAPAAG
jgi:hypothetical protein